MATQDDDGFTRTPPHDVRAEQCTLGGMLLAKDAISDVIEILRPADHYRPAHQIIHEAILGLYTRGEPADAITIANLLTEQGQISRVGHAAYLHTLINTVPTAANAAYYAQIVRKHAIRRRVIEAGTRIVQLGYNDDADETNVADRAQAEAYAITDQRNGNQARLMADLIPPALDELEAISSRGDGTVGVPTGLADLDQLLNGLHPGQLIIIGARPAVGKSTLALDFARHAAIRHHLPSVVFSLEMSRIEIVFKILSAEARVPLHAMRAGRLSDDDWGRLARRMSEVADAPLWIDDSPALNIAEIRSKSRWLKQRHDLRFVVVDYLQLMSSAGPRRAENRAVEVGEISRSLKLLAKELEVPVVALSQLNRGPEQRHDKKPLLSDLRESGGLEQDADAVLLLHRDDAYERESPRAGEADLIVAKNRNGPVATVTVAFQGHYSRFVDMAPS